MIAGSQVVPGLAETAAVAVYIPQELAVQVEDGAVVAGHGQLVEALLFNFHQALEHNAEVVFTLFDALGSKDGSDAALFHRGGQNILAAHKISFIVCVAQAVALGLGVHGVKAAAGNRLLGFPGKLGVEGFTLFSVAGRKVHSQDGGDGGRKLLGIEHAVVVGLPCHRHVLAEGDEPGMVGSADAGAVAAEGGAVATAMVTGEDIGGLALVERIRLAGLHDAADIEVCPVDGLQVMVVCTSVGIFVRIPEAHVEHLGMLFLEGFHGHAVSDAVQALGISEAAVGNTGIHILHPAGHVAVREGRLVGAAGLETAALIVHGKADALPGGIHHNLSLVAGILVHHFQHAHVGVGVGVVGIYAGVIGPAAEHLAVSGIRETHGIGHLHEAVFGAVSQHVAVLGRIAPDEGHQGLPALFGRIPPVFFLQGFRVLHKAGIAHKVLIGPAVQFLPAQPVEGNDDQTGIIVPLAAGHQRRQRQDTQQNNSLHSMVGFGYNLIFPDFSTWTVLLSPFPQVTTRVKGTLVVTVTTGFSEADLRAATLRPTTPSGPKG